MPRGAAVSTTHHSSIESATPAPCRTRRAEWLARHQHLRIVADGRGRCLCRRRPPIRRGNRRLDRTEYLLCRNPLEDEELRRPTGKNTDTLEPAARPADRHRLAAAHGHHTTGRRVRPARTAEHRLAPYHRAPRPPRSAGTSTLRTDLPDYTDLTRERPDPSGMCPIRPRPRDGGDGSVTVRTARLLVPRWLVRV